MNAWYPRKRHKYTGYSNIKPLPFDISGYSWERGYKFRLGLQILSDVGYIRGKSCLNVQNN